LLLEPENVKYSAYETNGLIKHQPTRMLEILKKTAVKASYFDFSKKKNQHLLMVNSCKLTTMCKLCHHADSTQ